MFHKYKVKQNDDSGLEQKRNFLKIQHRFYSEFDFTKRKDNIYHFSYFHLFVLKIISSKFFLTNLF